MKTKIKYLNFIGLILLVVILSKIDLSRVAQYLKNTDYRYLLLAYPFILLNVYLKSIRWNLLMRSQGVRIPLFKTFYVYLWGFYFGTVTPGRIGEVSKAIYFKENFENLGKSFVSVFVDRIYDVAIRVGLLFLLYPLYSNLFDFKYIGFFILAIIILIGIIILIRLKSIRNIIIKLSKILLPKKYYPVIKNNISGFVNDTMTMITSVKLIAVSVLLTVPSFFCYCVVAYAIQKSFAIDMHFIYNVFCIVVSSLAAIVPISISGLGVREAVMIYLFGNVGLATEAAVLFSLSLFALSPILALHGWIVNTIMMIINRKGGEDKKIKLPDSESDNSE